MNDNTKEGNDICQSGKDNLALNALVVLGHAEIFQGIPKFDRMF